MDAAESIVAMHLFVFCKKHYSKSFKQIAMKIYGGVRCGKRKN